MNSIKLASLPLSGFIAQLVEPRAPVFAEVTSSNPVEALIFQASSLKLENLLR